MYSDSSSNCGHFLHIVYNFQYTILITHLERALPAEARLWGLFCNTIIYPFQIVYFHIVFEHCLT